MSLLPPELCAALVFPGQIIPYSWVVAVAAGIWAVLRVIETIAPVSAGMVPILGALLTGFELHKHKLLAFTILYIAVSAAIVAGKIPVCTAYLPAA